MAESITQLSGGESLPSYARSAGHVTGSVPYNDAATTAYKDLARYYYYYPQCNPDVVTAHGLHQHHHHHQHQQQQQQQQQLPVLIHSHDGGGAVVYHADENGAGGEGAAPETTGRAGDGYGEGPALPRYYAAAARSPSAGPAAGLVVDGCQRPMTAPVAGWTPTDHGQFHRIHSLQHRTLHHVN